MKPLGDPLRPSTIPSIRTSFLKCTAEASKAASAPQYTYLAYNSHPRVFGLKLMLCSLNFDVVQAQCNPKYTITTTFTIGTPQKGPKALDILISPLFMSFARFTTFRLVLHSYKSPISRPNPKPYTPVYPKPYGSFPM